MKWRIVYSRDDEINTGKGWYAEKVLPTYQQTKAYKTQQALLRAIEKKDKEGEK